MKLRKSDEEWKEKYAKPHKWFAWFPVIVENGTIVWLERVMRYKHHRNGMYWFYNRIEK